MKLYEIDQAIDDLVDPETGEILDFDAFEKLQMDRDQKIENMVLKLKNLTAEAKMVKEEEDRLSKRRKALENDSARLKDYLSRILDGEKFKTARCFVSYRGSKSLQVVDNTAAVEWLIENGHSDLVTYDAPTISKNDVKAMLQVGVVIPGVVIAESTSLTVR